MKRSINTLLVLCCIVLIAGCRKDKPISPTLVISNLSYNPAKITIRQAVTTYFIHGTINFENAAGGIRYLNLTTSAGDNILTVTVPYNVQTKGELSGTFEVTTPETPGTYSFQIWVIDGMGNSSNKLQGTVQAIIDDSGTTWSVVSQTWPLLKAIWANGQYIAVGDRGIILTSQDGVNWTERNSGTTAILRGITWSGTQYLVVGDINTILSSPDGIKWTRRFSGTVGTAFHFHSVVWSGTSYVAVGEEGMSNKTVIVNSPDGITWTNNPYAVTGGNINAVIWSGTEFLAVGKAFGAALLLTSANGIDWANKSNLINYTGEAQLMDIIFTGTRYVAVGFGLTASSADGITWNVNNTITGGITGVVWSGNKFIASGYNGIFISTDGINWTKSYDSNYPLYSITWSGTQYVCVGFISPVILLSPSL